MNFGFYCKTISFEFMLQTLIKDILEEEIHLLNYCYKTTQVCIDRQQILYLKQKQIL